MLGITAEEVNYNVTSGFDVVREIILKS